MNDAFGVLALLFRLEGCGNIVRVIDVASLSGDKMRNDIMFTLSSGPCFVDANEMR